MKPSHVNGKEEVSGKKEEVEILEASKGNEARRKKEKKGRMEGESWGGNL